MKPTILGAIFARGGSKGVPRKNIRLLNGKPLIAYAIETAKAVPLIDRVIVSTEDDEIASVARKFGAEIPFKRPRALAQDDAAIEPSWKHAIRAMEELSQHAIDILVSIPTTAPLRHPSDIQNCIQKLLDSDADIVITMTQAQRNPYFNMVRLDRQENAQVVISSAKPICQRQKAPVVYDMTTVAYAARREFVLKCGSIFDGKVKAVIIPPERALDIDTPFDFKIAELLLKNKKPCDPSQSS